MVFVRAFSSAARESYDGIRPYRNYLFAIARNLVIDEFRKGHRELISLEENRVKSQNQEYSELDPEEQALEQELGKQVDEFEASLSGDERAVFKVRFRQGLSIEGSAIQLGISEHRVKSTERRLKKRFFNRMRKHGYFEGYRYGRRGLEKIMLVVWGLGVVV